MPAKTIKDYFTTVDVSVKDLPPSIRHSNIQAVASHARVCRWQAGRVQEDFCRGQSKLPSTLPGMAALCYFKSTGSFPELKESTVRGWKNVYCTELREAFATWRGDGGAGKIVLEGYMEGGRCCEFPDRRCNS